MKSSPILLSFSLIFLVATQNVFLVHAMEEPPAKRLRSAAGSTATAPLPPDERLLHAAALDNPEAIAKALDNGANINAQTALGGCTALHLVASKPSPAATILLLHRLDTILASRSLHGMSRASFVNAQDKCTYTALHYAAAFNRRETVVALLKAGADKTLKNCKGQTPAEVARSSYHNDLADLIEGWIPEANL
jgi:ankyrin repeat protein